jgi:hypothetical protein
MTVAAILWLVSATAPDGGAAAPCAPGSAAAHLRAGDALSDASDEGGALAEYRCAFQIDGSPKALAQVAAAEMALGRWVDAERDLDKALGHEQDPWIRAHRAQLNSALETIHDNLGDLMIEGSPAGAEIVVDGRPVGPRLPLRAPLRLPTGRVDIEVRARGFAPVHRERRIEPRGLALESIELVPLAAPTMVPPPSAPVEPVAPSSRGPNAERPDAPSDTPPAARLGPAWITLGASLLFLGGGVAFHLLRETRADDFNGHCDNALVGRGQSDCQNLYDGVQLAQKIAIGGYVGAAVLGAASTYLFLSRRDAAAARGAGHAFGCGPEPSQYGVRCATVF